MIKRTRIKFIAVTFAIVTVILTAFGCAVLITTYTKNISEADRLLERTLSDSGRDTPPAGGGKNNTPDMIYAEADYNGNILKSDYSSDFYGESYVQELIAQILKKGTDRGSLDDMRYYKKQTANGITVAVYDMSSENTVYNRLVVTVTASAVSAALLIFALLIPLSYWVVKPAQNALSKQKRFISDAGHELKTPITVISAGAELILKQAEEHTDGQTAKWAENIKSQAQKMNGMVYELLTLARLDEQTAHQKSVFNLSETVLSCVLQFESVAFEAGKKYGYSVEPDISYSGDEQSVKTAVEILCDNAVKHSDKNAEIYIGLKKSSKPILTVFNTGGALEPAELSRIFERFYRSKAGRARSGGTGLGLSILKSLSEANKWNVSVELKEGGALFTVVF